MPAVHPLPTRLLDSIAMILLITLLISMGFATEVRAAPGACVVDPLLGNPIRIVMSTTSGDIEIELWPDIAPCSVSNFLGYMNSGRYDGTFIHRTVSGFVIQGGGYEYDSATNAFASIPRDPAVVNEPGRSNLTGTIAMARIGGQVDSATSEFFINLADNTALDSVDQGFTVFGKVIAADMPVVDAIATLPRLVGRWWLNTALREIFAELPVQALPSLPPGGYGCFDPDATPMFGLSGWTRALLDITRTVLEPDPLTGSEYLLSSSCSGSGAVGPPSVPCTTDRIVAYRTATAWVLDPTPMTCEQIAESEQSLAARRNDQQPQVAANLVEISTVTLPEPNSLVWLGPGLVGLYRLLRGRAVPHGRSAPDSE